MCMLDSNAKPSRPNQLAALNWVSNPSRFMPHGLSGLLSIAIGLHLIFCHSLVGNLDPYTLNSTDGSVTISDVPCRVVAYAMATSWNALGGYRIVNKAPPNSRTSFKRCAILQICLSFYVLRFLPHMSRIQFGGSKNILQVLDGIVTTTSVMCTLSFLEAAIDLSKTSMILGQAIVIGVFGIMLLSFYPIQLSIQGEDWWRCIQDRYPIQASGMVAYIYIPATVTFSSILFGATLYQRKIISSNEFGVVTMLTILICLLSTVLSQEVHIPDVSTQRIYLPCQDPPAGSWEEKILIALDFSQYARSILTRFFGIKFG